MESDLIDWLRSRLPAHPCLRLGVGDDAAVLQLGAGAPCVMTTDIISDRIDFVLADVALALPRHGGLTLAQELYEGMLPLATRHDVAVAGGDTHAWDGPLLISITAVGEVLPGGPLRRDAARPGDDLLVTGTLGGSILGRHLDFEPRVREALLLSERYALHAGIDISDGLAIDAARLAAASACGVAIDLARVPVSDAARTLARNARDDDRTALDHALADGEDFELLLAVSRQTADQILADRPLDLPLTRIGQCVQTPGLWQRGRDGQLRSLPPTGYEHPLTP